MAQQYRRTCNYCGKTWHSLVQREQQIGQIKNQAAFATIGNCCGDNSQNMRNIDAGSDSLTKLRQCPECQSSDYTEEIVGDK